MLSEISQSHTAWFHLYKVSKLVDIIEAENRMVGARGWGKGKWEIVFQWGWSFCYARWISFRDLLYNIIPIVNNMVLYTLKYVKRIDFMLSVLLSVPYQRTIAQNNARKFLEVMAIFSTWLWWWYQKYIENCKLIKMYTLNVCNL